MKSIGNTGVGVDGENNTAEPGNKKNNLNWWQPSLILFVRMSGWIVGPVIISIYLGRWLDNKFGTQPWLFLSVVGLSFVVSMFAIIKFTIEEFKKIDKNNQADKK